MTDSTGLPRRRGRPAIGTAITFRLDTRLHDEICREALARDLPVAAILRERVRRNSAPTKQTAVSERVG